MIEDQLVSAGAVQATLCLERALEQNDFGVVALFDVGDEVGDGDFLRTRDLVEPPRKQDGNQDDRHPVDDESSQSAVHKTSVLEGLG